MEGQRGDESPPPLPPVELRARPRGISDSGDPPDASTTSAAGEVGCPTEAEWLGGGGGGGGGEGGEGGGSGATSCKTARSRPLRWSRGAGGGEAARMRAMPIQRAGLPTPMATPQVCGSSTAGAAGAADVAEGRDPEEVVDANDDEEVEEEVEVVEAVEEVEEEAMGGAAEARAREAMSSMTWQHVQRMRAVLSTKKALPTSRGGPPSVRAPTATTARCQVGTAPAPADDRR